METLEDIFYAVLIALLMSYRGDFNDDTKEKQTYEYTQPRG